VKTTILTIGLCLMVALPSLAGRSDDERELIDKGLYDLGRAPPPGSYRGKFVCSSVDHCSSSGNYAELVERAMYNLRLVPGEWLMVETPDGKPVKIEVLKGTDNSNLIIKRTGAVLDPNPQSDVVSKEKLKEWQKTKSGYLGRKRLHRPHRKNPNYVRPTFWWAVRSFSRHMWGRMGGRRW
jgi:hypothetical protein